MLDRRGIRLPAPLPLVDGEVPAHEIMAADAGGTTWRLANGGTVRLTVAAEGDALRLDVVAEGLARPLEALGLRFDGVTGVRRYLRNGYQSWDGSWFERPGTPAGDGPPAKAPTLGFAATALLPHGAGTLVLGHDRHDRFQTRFRFGGTADALVLDAETLLDRTGAAVTESLYLFDDEAAEPALRRWSARVAAASPLPPRMGDRRLTGWCSWYNHYAAIDEATIRAEIASAAAFRDAHGGPLDVFQIDDGFTPEMGDWLRVRPQFPNGVAPLLAEAAAAGFRPGLWIAPFLVGNRSRLAAEHPDWLVADAASGEPFVAFRFFGEFRWHKRSEEYHVLDATHPGAAAYITRVVRTWVHDWGARYLKADFLLHGAEYGPERVRWHVPGLSRIAVWRRMMELIRDAAGPDVIVAGCGCPLWASVGLVDAVRVGRDVGVTWHGEYSAESLIRDLQARNHAHGTLWQADPDCLLLRDRYHDMTGGEVEALARFAAGCGGALMTSDTLADLPADRAVLFAELLRAGTAGCDFPLLGAEGGLVRQRLRGGSDAGEENHFNPTNEPIDLLPARTLATRSA